MSIDWGDAPTWVAAFFAAGAAAFAGGTLRSQRQQISEQQAFIAEQSANLALEREALLAAADSRREEQARLVSVSRRNLEPLLWNDSTAPITDVECMIDGHPAVVGMAMDARSARHNFGIAFGDARSFECPVAEVPPGRVVLFGSNRSVRGHDVEFAFTDDAGHRWSLSQYGVLRPASD